MYDIPNDIDLSSLETGGQAPTDSAGLPSAQTQAPTDSGFDPNMMIKYKASGRDLQEPLSAVINRAQRGYDYAQLVEQHKQQVSQQQAEWQQRQQQIAEWEAQWKPYHEFASQNPQWADHVRQMWDSRFNATQMAQPSPTDLNSQQQMQQQMQLPPQVQQELAQMRQFMSEVKEREQLAVQAQQDAALNSEIDSVKKSFPDIDFGHTDPATGESLEMRVMRHAQENRIHNFSAAFRDFYFDKLQERAIMQAKENVAKTIQTQNKQGFLARSDQSMVQAGSLPQGSTRMSYHQLMELAAKDLGFN